MGAIDKELASAEVLMAIEAGSSERDALRKISNKYKISDWHIRGTLHSIVFETLRRLNVIDLLIKESLQKGTIEKLYPLLRNLIRVGVHQIKFAEGSAPKITKTIVQLVKNKYRKSVSNFTNALLRRIEHLELTSFITNSTDTLNLSLQYYHPLWFIEYLIKLIGLADTIAFLKSSLDEMGLYVRINTIKTDMDYVMEQMQRDEYFFSVDRDLDDVLLIREWKKPIIHSSLFKDGYLYIQDKASALVSHVVNPQNAETVFDLCAAPGGKSMHMGQLLRNSGQVVAFDRSHRRLLELTQKLSLYNLHNIDVINANGDKAPKFVKKKADKILIDPPCSGTGTFTARPYGKWKLRPSDIEIISEVQWRLLVAAVKLLHPSGEIIYSTCSITLEENEKLIEKFLKVFPDFSSVPTTPFIGTPGFLGLDKTQRLWPHLHGTEGFFIAKLRRD